jgi:hypothetical protein
MENPQEYFSIKAQNMNLLDCSGLFENESLYIEGVLNKILKLKNESDYPFNLFFTKNHILYFNLFDRKKRININRYLQVEEILSYLINKNYLIKLKQYAKQKNELEAINMKNILNKYLFGNKPELFCDLNNFSNENDDEEITPRKLFNFICEQSSKNLICEESSKNLICEESSKSFEYINNDSMYEYLEDDLNHLIIKSNEYIKTQPYENFFNTLDSRTGPIPFTHSFFKEEKNEYDYLSYQEKLDSYATSFLNTISRNISRLPVIYYYFNERRNVYVYSSYQKMLEASVKKITNKFSGACSIHISLNRKILNLFIKDINKLRKIFPKLDLRVKAESAFNSSMHDIEFPTEMIE